MPPFGPNVLATTATPEEIELKEKSIELISEAAEIAKHLLPRYDYRRPSSEHRSAVALYHAEEQAADEFTQAWLERDSLFIYTQLAQIALIQMQFHINRNLHCMWLSI